MSKIQIEDGLVARVSNTVSKYRLLDGGSRVTVAFSGGKDSSCTAKLLTAVGFNVGLAAVDMGYSHGWASRIRSLAHQLALECDVLPVRDPRFQNQLEPRVGAAIRQRLVILDEISSDAPEAVSPCTQCYNTKVEALRDYMVKNGYSWVAFGHHATDSISSLIKSALMYIDRWDRAHTIWTRTNFQTLIDELVKELSSRATIGSITDRIVDLAGRGLAGTDEPPVQSLHREIPALRLARPLFEVFEYEILEISEPSILSPEPSGCGHGATRETRTPREMVHHGLLDGLSESEPGRKWLRFFMQLVKSGLRGNGELNVNTRNRREELLGSGYRSGTGSDIKL